MLLETMASYNYELDVDQKINTSPTTLSSYLTIQPTMTNSNPSPLDQHTSTTTHTSSYLPVQHHELNQVPRQQLNLPILPNLTQTSPLRPTDSKLRCMYTNATSIINKLDLIETFLVTNNVDLMFITETWLQDYHLADIPDYTLYRTDRTTQGGGVCIYVKATIQSHLLPNATTPTCSEQVWCVLRFGTETTLCGCIYRPPSALRSNKTMECDEICHSITSYASLPYSGILLCGDFSFH